MRRNVVVTILLSRVLVFSLLVIGSQITFLGKEYGNTIWRTEVALSGERLLPELIRITISGDAWHYAGWRGMVARHSRLTRGIPCGAFLECGTRETTSQMREST